MKKYYFLFPIILLLTLCELKKQDYIMLSDKKLNAELFSAIANKKIFFGHKSVGNNIIQGINDIALKNNTKLNILEYTDREHFDYGGNGLFHRKIGENRDPKSKIDEFKSILLKDSLGKNIDIALLKLCYVDVNQSTDIQNLFSYYQTTIDEIKLTYPQLVIVHSTVPLTVHAVSLKQRIKLLLMGDVDNVKRNHYNALLRRAYQKKEPLFDIAAAESTYPDGKKSLFSYRGDKYESLVKMYSNDGGHLNDIGRKKVALHFLKMFVSTGN